MSDILENLEARWQEPGANPIARRHRSAHQRDSVHDATARQMAPSRDAALAYIEATSISRVPTRALRHDALNLPAGTNTILYMTELARRVVAGESDMAESQLHARRIDGRCQHRVPRDPHQHNFGHAARSQETLAGGRVLHDVIRSEARLWLEVDARRPAGTRLLATAQRNFGHDRRQPAATGRACGTADHPTNAILDMRREGGA